MEHALKLTEAQHQKASLEIARRLGWRCAHFPTSNPEGRFRTVTAADAVGFPDVTAIRERLIFLEFKSEKGRLRTEQAVWLDALLEAGCEAYIVRPRDTDALEAVLKVKDTRADPGAVFSTGFELMTATRIEVAKELAKQAA